MDASFELRPPALSRVFDREFLGRKWKHVIEPRVVYDYVTGVNNFPNILRFDQRDILSDTNEVEYGLVQRLYAKRTSMGNQICGQPGMPALFIGGAAPHGQVPWERQQQPVETPCEDGTQAREIVTWELAQKYFLDPTFGGALFPGRSNVLTSTVDLTGIAFLTSARHLSPLISRLRIQTSANTDVEWDMDYDFTLSHMTASTVLRQLPPGAIHARRRRCLPASAARNCRHHRVDHQRRYLACVTTVQPVPALARLRPHRQTGDSAPPPISASTPIWSSCSTRLCKPPTTGTVADLILNFAVLPWARSATRINIVSLSRWPIWDRWAICGGRKDYSEPGEARSSQSVPIKATLAAQSGLPSKPLATAACNSVRSAVTKTRP